MNEQWINDQLKREIEAETPDILDQLLLECRQEETAAGTEENAGPETAFRSEAEPAFEETVRPETAREKKPPKTVKRRYLYITIAAAAAVLLIVSLIGNIIPVRNIAPQEETKVVEAQEPKETLAPETAAVEEIAVARVALDVNPSVEMEVDREERVIRSIALNEDGQTILDHIDLSGANLTVASYAIIGAMLSEGYLTDNTNSILVSVTSDQKETGKKLQEELSSKLNTYLENSQIGAAIVGQFVDNDESLKQFAEENGISSGKAWIIRQLAAENSRMTEESLLKLSTQDLLLLWTSRVLDKKPQPESGQPAADTEASVAYGKVHAGTYISADDAAAKALEHVGISAGEAGYLSAEYDCENGMIIYEVEFSYNGQKYEVDVNAATGEVLAMETEALGPGSVTLDDDDDWDDDDRYEADDDWDDDDRYEADDDWDDDDRYEADDDRDDDWDDDDRYEADDDDWDDDDRDDDRDDDDDDDEDDRDDDDDDDDD